MNKFTFVDLFSGIGGFHIGLSKIGGECLMACDIDPIARKTYEANFKIKPRGDIYDIAVDTIPDFDLMCAGFPCQSFSRIGPGGGLRDPRGAVFFELIRILHKKRPKAFILENVKGLLSHEQGRTFETIVSALETCGYNVNHKVLEAKDFGLPQIRKRLFLVGIDKKFSSNFFFPKPTGCSLNLSDVMNGTAQREFAFTIRVGGRKSGIRNKYNWDCYIVDGNPRYISVSECLKLQGFSEDFYLAGSEEQQYRQVGNAVPTTIVTAIGYSLLKTGIFPI